MLSTSCSHPRALGAHSLDIEDGVLWVHGGLVLRGLSDETLLGGEGDERRGGEASLLVGAVLRLSEKMSSSLTRFLAKFQRPNIHDLNTGALIIGDTRVGGSEIDANGTVVYFVRHIDVCCGRK